MSNVLMAVLGVILFIGLALAGTLFLGDYLRTTSRDGQAAQIVNEGQQIKHAYDMRRTMTGSPLVLSSAEEELNTLRTEGYLKSIPPGFQTEWVIGQSGVAMTVLGDNDGAQRVCVRARERIGIPNPEAVLACDDLSITDQDPCCRIPG